MTFSIVARSADARLFGVAIASSSPAVAARCAYARAAVGAAVSQNVTDPALGPRLLEGLAAGAAPEQALELCLQSTPFGAYRQLLAIGPRGPPVAHSGALALGCAGVALGAHAAAAGNLLCDAGIPAAMLAAFEADRGPLAARLLGALRAALALGGEAGPVHSAGLLVVRELSWPIIDLRVDWHDADPVAALGALWERYAPQVEDYVQRALDPSRAPGFGVPGDCSATAR
ncbi:MAG TPA: DUF1028 domain-containing protein [Steroidobacteraceae bacterium]|nr:DUF1028 domain-containing protein [Steroidobacteraceae bacterium]HUA89667.1 DUF1028 domain-containing protein [Steroidobacteraceae bacterium]